MLTVGRGPAKVRSEMGKIFCLGCLIAFFYIKKILFFWETCKLNY